MEDLMPVVQAPLLYYRSHDSAKLDENNDRRLHMLKEQLRLDWDSVLRTMRTVGTVK